MRILDGGSYLRRRRFPCRLPNRGGGFFFFLQGSGRAIRTTTAAHNHAAGSVAASTVDAWNVPANHGGDQNDAGKTPRENSPERIGGAGKGTRRDGETFGAIMENRNAVA
ncbi:MAG: hypothetical protein IK077_16525 [Thermoguttaceae bacterium]|nr:hypothetical protein [Thermoguttaceae bacterium]